MVSQTNEASLETQIESFLAKGYCIGNLVDLDRILQSAQIFLLFFEAFRAKKY